MKCPICNGFIVLESYIPVYKDGKIVKLQKFVECVNGHRTEIKRKRGRKNIESKEAKNGYVTKIHKNVREG